MLLGWTALAAAQGATSKPRTLGGGVCAAANWVCVAHCIDATCVEECLREGCEEALERLQRCTSRAGCAPDDTQCAARQCGQICQRAFAPAPPSPEKEKPRPCAGFQVEWGGRVPEDVVGRWELSAATLRPEARTALERLNLAPRPDYRRTLEVTPEGCFVLETELEDATLGQGNHLDVRAWGTFAVADDTVVLRPKDGQTVGQVCGNPRVIGLSKERFLERRYIFSVEEDTLNLVADDPSKRTFQFQRMPARAPQRPARE